MPGVLEKVFGRGLDRVDSIQLTVGPMEMRVPGCVEMEEWRTLHEKEMEGLDGWEGIALLIKTFSTRPEFNSAETKPLADELKVHLTFGDFKTVMNWWFGLYGASMEDVKKISSDPNFRLKR